MNKLAVVILVCLLLTVIVSESIVVSSEEETIPEAPWPSFGGDQRNTGLSPYPTGQVDGKNQRSWDTNVSIESSPVISWDDSIYIGSDDGVLHAFYFDTNFGKLWSFETNGSVRSTPAVDQFGNIYFGSDDNNFYALNEDGSLNWSVETNNIIRSSPAIDDQGTVYVGSFDNHLYAIYPGGLEKWKFETEGAIHSSPAIGADGTIYIGSGDGNVYAINPDGTEKWRFETDAEIHSSPTVGEDGSVYIGSSDANLYALSANGDFKWGYSTEGSIRSSAAIGANGTIYFGSDDGDFYSLNENGSLEWQFGTNEAIVSSPAIGGDGTIYFGSMDGYTYALDEKGSLKWSRSIGGKVISSPAIGRTGTVYIASTRGLFYAFMGVPSEPRDPTLDVDDGKLILNWVPPLDKGGSELIGYRIYKGTEPDVLRLFSVIPDTQSFTDGNVTIGQMYYYQVSALNAAGEGSRSEIVNAIAAEIPDRPENLGSWAGDERVELTWESPNYTGGVEIEEYRIYREEEGIELTHIDTVSAEVLKYEDENVTNRITYRYRVSAVNPAGEGRISEEASAMPTPRYSLLYCFFIPTVIIISLLILWFFLWYRRWGKHSNIPFQDDKLGKQ